MKTEDNKKTKEKIKAKQIKDPAFINELKNYESKMTVRNYKFGVLYCTDGQTKEEEMFSNEHGSPQYEEFLALLGERINLKYWNNYRAGLDVEHGTTGQCSQYTRYEDAEVMFHVSTLLPYSHYNPQQLERKRHLGNDIVVLIYKEGNSPYIPATIKSDFNHVLVVVQRVEKGFGIGIARKEGVPAFGPRLPLPCRIEDEKILRDFLLCTLINGEVASYEAPSFKFKMQRTRLAILEQMEKEWQPK